jgi:hypothetical protein
MVHPIEREQKLVTVLTKINNGAKEMCVPPPACCILRPAPLLSPAPPLLSPTHPACLALKWWFFGTGRRKAQWDMPFKVPGCAPSPPPPDRILLGWALVLGLPSSVFVYSHIQDVEERKLGEPE